MKRPGWLGAKDGDDSSEEPGDDERSEERESKRGDDRKRDGESAAERSARRAAAREERGEGSSAARRKLGDRVGKSDEAPKPEPKGAEGSEDSKGAEGSGAEGSEDSKKPERRKQRPAPVANRKSAGAAKGSAKAKADEPAKKLNRPRRQPGSGATTEKRQRGPEGEQSGRSRREVGKDSERKPDAGQKPGEKDKKPERTRGREDRDGESRRSGDDEGRRRRDRRRDGDGGRGERKRDRGDRPAAGKRARAGAVAFAGALKRGAIDTRKWAAANGPKAGRMLLAGLGAVFALFFEVLGFVLNLAFAAWRVVARPVRAVLGVLDRATRAVSRRLTPARALTIVVAGAAILLALSQYADYRSISIGNGAYADVQSLAPAPETGRLQAGDPHSYVFVPVAIACLLLLAVATIGGRWRACRLIALAGFAAIVVALIVDRPAGLDPGDAALAFEGVKAKLIGGFYAQIAAGVLLIGSSSLLARELRLAEATKRVPARRSAEHGDAKEPRLRRRATGRSTGTGPGTEGTARA